ncbi:MAG: M24 family metallopeptidase [Candidatus Micrarchaeota archaeon]|nr:M24 family metallopeptidase [Candidatus Micrarchaeota archaeon]
MNEIAQRRKRLFSGAKFSSALFYGGDGAQGASFEYFSGCRIEGAYLALKRNAGTILTHDMLFSQAKKQGSYPAKLIGRKNAPFLLRKACGSGKVGFSPSEMSFARHSALAKKAHLKFVDAGEKIGAVRGEKSAGEKARIVSAYKIARKILEELRPWDYSTEHELACALKIAALEKGCEHSFEPIVATGKNSSMPHHTPGRKKLDDFVLVDFGVKKESYCSDLTRCYFKGRKGLERQREAYLKCQETYHEIVESLPDCKNGADVAKLAKQVMGKKGLPEMIHAIGHGIGLQVHEFPHLGSKSKDSLRNAALAIEPAVYYSRFGVRYEGMALNFGNKWRTE